MPFGVREEGARQRRVLWSVFAGQPVRKEGVPQGGEMKVWLDTLPPPKGKGWTWVTEAEEAVKLIASRNVTKISLWGYMVAVSKEVL